MSSTPSPTQSMSAPVAAPAERPDIETSGEAYARRFAGAVGAWFLRAQELTTLRLLAPYPEVRVLDVGGGHGQVTAALIAHGHRVTVFGSADCCRRRIEPFLAAGTCTFVAGDLLHLPFPDRGYDVVLSYRLLAHVTPWTTLVTELARVARHAMLIDVPTRRSVNALAPWLFRLKKRVEGDTRPFALFDERMVLDVAAAAGLMPDGRYAQFLLPMAFHRLLGAPRVSALGEQIFRVMGATHRFGSPVILRLVRRER